MKVRDIKQYREQILVKRTDLDYDNFCLGEKEEPLLKDFYGSGKNIDNIVGQISKFAKNTQTQIFYEFLQNADDAKASKLAITFNEQWFLVVNNGEPFKTDGTEAPGQLRSFLNKEDSEKAFDDESIGKYGLGSKLLYDLLTNQDAAEKKNERLTEAIISNLKSPILFSWSGIEQWNELKYWKKNDAFIHQNCKETNAPLLTKILYAYYPAYFQEKKKLRDGTVKELFSASDIENLQSVFFGDGQNSFFNKQSEFSFEKGTAILIPLGKGVSESLQNAIDDSNGNLINRLATSLSFLESPKKIFTEKIFINDVVIKPIYKKENTIEVKYEGKQKDKNGYYQPHTFDVKILLPTEINAINENLCNFYQFLPISNETKGLGFIINAEELELIQNRQEVDWDTYSGSRIKIIGEKLIEKLEVIAQNDKPLYFHFLKCFLRAKGNFLEEYLENPIKTFLLKNLPSNKNSNQNSENIKIKSTQLNINPSDIGLDFHWLDESFKDNYKDFEIKFGLPTWTINNLLEKAETENVRSWVKNLSEADYKQLLSELNGTPNFPFIKTSNGNFLTRAELKNNENIIPLISKTKDLKDIFDAQGIEYTNITLLEYESLLPSIDLLDRLKKEIEKIKPSLDENQKYITFKTFKTHFAGKEKELAIFKNRKGDFYKLGQLVKNDTDFAPSGILYDFQIDPTEPYLNEYEGCFLKENEVWNVIRGNWGRINLTADNFLRAVGDFDTLYSKGGNTNKLDKTFDWLSTINGFSNKENVFYQKAWADTITENDYKVLVGIIRRITDFKVLSFENLKKLSTVNFAELPTNGFTSIKDKIKVGVDTFMFSLDEIRVLNNIKGSSGFFDHFIITAQDQDKYEVKIKENNDIQFFTNDENVNEFLQKYYYKLPKNIVKLFEEDGSLKTPIDANLQTWIDTFGANPVFIDLIVDSNENITKTKFLSKCEITLATNNEIESYTDKFEGKAIKLMLKEDSWINAFKDKITIDDKKLSHYNYKEEVTGGFKLSELLPKYIGISNTLEEIKKKLKGINSLSKIFEAETYKSETIDFDLTQIKTLSNAEQLSFLIYYRNKENKNKSLAEFNIYNLSDNDILTSLYEHNLTCFSQFSNGKNWFAIHNYIDTQSILFSEEEKLPDFINNWRATDIKKTQFLKEVGLKTEESDIFKFRTALNENKGAKENIDKIIESKYWSEKTQIWLKERFKDVFERSGSIYNTIQAFFDVYAEKYGIDNIFRLVVAKDEIKVVIEKFENQGFKVILINKEFNEVWYDVIKDNSNYIFYDVDDAKNINSKIEKEAKIEGEFIEDKNIPEWKDKKYEKWREILKNKYNIFFSPTELPFQYTLYLGSRQEAINKGYKNGLRAKKEENGTKKLFLFKEQGKNERKLLLENRDYLFSPTTDDLTRLIELDYENETENKGNGDGNINIPEATDEDKTFLEEFAKRILENKEAIMAGHFGRGNDVKNHNPEKEKEEEQDTTIDPLAGLIGERLVYLYLKHRSTSSENVKYVAENEPAYDIVFNENRVRFLLEIKSSKKKDAASIPFYMKRSQYDFLYNHPEEENYFIIRVSLPTFGLMDLYDEMLNESWLKLIAQVKATKREVEIPDDTRQQAILIIDKYINERIDSLSNKFSQKINRMAFRVKVPAKSNEDFDDY